MQTAHQCCSLFSPAFKHCNGNCARPRHMLLQQPAQHAVHHRLWQYQGLSKLRFCACLQHLSFLAGKLHCHLILQRALSTTLVCRGKTTSCKATSISHCRLLLTRRKSDLRDWMTHELKHDLPQWCDAAFILHVTNPSSDLTSSAVPEHLQT